MINLRTFIKHSVVNYIKPSASSLSFSTGNISSSSSSSDDEKKRKSSLKANTDNLSNKPNVEEKKESLQKRNSEEALKKLNLLLTQMTQNEPTTSQPKSKLELAKPINRRKKTVASEPKTDTNVNPVKRMFNAVKEVAKVVDGDVKQTEAELLQKLLYPVKIETGSIPSNNLSDIVKDMKIDRDATTSVNIVSRAQQVRQILKTVKTQDATTRATVTRSRDVKRRPVPDMPDHDQIIEERVNLFGEVGLGIFPPAAEVNTWPTQDFNKTWNTLEERELRLAVIHPPANYFQQMIQWTEQGKIWKFPIDNEQDMDAEKSIYFTEHVFLEKYIEPWCPPKGPIRHFMELVLVGLSKNYHLSLEDKKEHIEWFKSYFNEKKVLLKEIEAIPADFEFIKDNSNKIAAS